MNRKTFLKGCLFTGLSPSLFAAPQTAFSEIKKNVVLIVVDYGFMPSKFFGPYQEFFDRFKDEKTLFNNLQQPTFRRGHYAQNAVLTGFSPDDKSRFPGQFISLDQYIVDNSLRKNRHKSLNISTGRSKISWNSLGQSMPSLSSVQDLYNLLFGKENIQQVIQDKKDQQKSLIILKEQIKNNDFAVKEIKEMHKVLSEDIKQIDTDIEWAKKPKPKVDFKLSPESSTGDLFVDIEYAFDLINLAFQTQQSRIAVVHFDGSAKQKDLNGVNMGYHNLTHHRDDPEKCKQLEIIESHILNSVSSFLEKVKKNNLLDDTIIFLTSAMGNANKHNNKNLPAILFGGGFNHQKNIDCMASREPDITLANIHNSILKQMGLRPKNIAGESKSISRLFS